MSKKVLLIWPPINNLLGFKGIQTGLFVDHQLELGLLYLASFLESKGVEVLLLDMSLYNDPEKQLISILQRHNFDFIGITSYTNTINSANRIAGIIKKFNKAKIVVGGAHASALPEETLGIFRNFDYLVYGEGEETFAELIFEKDVSDIKGLVWRDNGRIIKNPIREPMEDLDKLPFPARHLLDLDKYIPSITNYRRLPSTGILSSRGCFYQCTFCSRAGTRLSKQVKFRSVENFIKEIEFCIENYKIYDFRFFDDVFVTPKNRLMKFCQELLEKKIKINWCCYSRVDTMDEEMLWMMRKSGCYHIKYGIEFGTQKWLTKTKKNTTLEQARKVINSTKRLGILAKVDFIIGMPGETIAEIRKTINFAKELNATYTTFNIFTPLPGSEIFEELKTDGKLYTYDYDTYFKSRKNIVSDQLDFTILENLLKDGYKKVYLNPRFFRDILIYLVKNPFLVEIKTFVKGFFVFLKTLF